MFSMKTWDEEACDETTLRLASELAKRFFARLGPDEPYSALVDLRRFDVLLGTDPAIFTNAEDYRHFAAGVGLLKKLPSLPLGVDAKLSAVKKFLEGEERCRETNLIFNLWKLGRFQFRPAVESILHATQRKIQKIVGEVPDPHEVRYRFSPGGASTSTKKKDSEIRRLITRLSHCSEELAGDPLLGEILATVPGLQSFLMEDCSSTDSFLLTIQRSRLDFVLKDATAMRIITIEPDMNKFVQNGYGDSLRARCKRAGIDLSDQSRNRELARIGSITGGIATVDLTNASGLQALGLVEHTWPPDWFETLVSIRSGYTAYEGTTFHMQAYAGMGNGTTFPVESITFYCLAEATMEYLRIVGPISIYGDDIIIPAAGFQFFRDVLRDLGLEVNSKKSFAHGPFRESCGADWYSGYAVRPAFLRGNMSYRRLYLLHNHYYRCGDLEAAGWFLDLIPHDFRVFGPDGYGDGHLLGDWEGKVYYHRTSEVTLAKCCKCDLIGVPHGRECYTAKTTKHRTSMWTFRTYGQQTRTKYYASKVDYLIPSYSIYIGARLLKDDHSAPRWVPSNLLRRITDVVGIRDVEIPSVPGNSPLFRGRRRAADELPPDSSAWVIGTPMPGAQGSRLLTVCTFERPSGF